VDRARAAAFAALVVVLSLSGAAVAAPNPESAQPAASVAWPASTALLLAEVQTGGASASDEFAEITNASAVPVDLVGLEVVYATSTGGTVTRKASWPASLVLEPGRHLLIANTSGVFASIADATYSGGFAATGGALVLRPIGGAPIDAVAWGDATNAFVEGTAAAAPAAGSSIERLPGGIGGNTIDTNDNSVDWLVQASPNPQNLVAPPVPAPAPSATPVPTVLPSASPVATPSPSEAPGPTETPGPTDTAEPTPLSTPLPTATPTVEPTTEPTPSPTPIPTPTPEPTFAATPTPEPTAVPTATPMPTATMPITVPIAVARAQADDTTATISGVLTTALGALEAGRKGFIQDASGGIALYLDVAALDPLPAGTIVLVQGTLDDRYAERTLRVILADVVVLGSDTLPPTIAIATGTIDERVEGSRVTLDGLTVGSPTVMADGLGILVDDGSGSVRAILGADALGAAVLPAGAHVAIAGPVGQHDSSGTGLEAYRVYATLAGELAVLPTPTPSPSASPSIAPSQSVAPTATATASPIATVEPTPTPMPVPTATPTATPAPTATRIPSPSPSPSPGPSAIPIATARRVTIGSTVAVSGVVTAEGGRLGTPPLIAIADDTAGIVVRVPDGVVIPGRGTTVRVIGQLAEPYGQLEIRPAASGVRVTGTGVIPTPISVGAEDLAEATEALLVQIVGTAKSTPTRSTSGDLTVDLFDGAGKAFRVAIDGSAGIATLGVPLNRPLRLTGIVGQHASRKGALDGYRLWLRDRADIVVMPAAGPSGSPGSSAATVSVAQALAAADGTDLTIEAVVTAGASLLDTSGRRVVVQDGTAAIEVLLPSGSAAPGVGTRLRATGEKAHAWDAPRLRASSVTSLGMGGVVAAASRAQILGVRDEWRLVRLAGTILSVERTGDRWRAELRLANGDRVPILGQAGAPISSTAIVTGRAATIVGIAKRPYPTATDRRFALLPRGRADVVIATPEGPAAHAAGLGNASDASGGGAAASRVTLAQDITPDTDLAALFEHLGETVHVGGLVSEMTTDGFLLDDGTAVARVVLEGDAAVLLPHIRAGDAVAAHGVVRQEGEELRLVVANAAGLVRVGDLGQAEPLVPGASGRDPESSSAVTLPPRAVDLAGAAGLLPAELSVATLGGLTVASLLVTLIRRRATAQRSRAAVLARLASLASVTARR
jgi:hypothetical protein